MGQERLVAEARSLVALRYQTYRHGRGHARITQMRSTWRCAGLQLTDG